MSNLIFPVLVLAAVSIFYTENGEAKALAQSREKRIPIYDRNTLADAISLDPRMKEEYKKIFLKLFEEQLEKNPRVGETIDPNKSLDPRMVEELKKQLLELFEEHLTKKLQLGENFFSYPRSGRAMNFFSYPRSGRAMNFFHYPRSGKRSDVLTDDTCCSKGIIIESGPTGKRSFCEGTKCCDGLAMRIAETNEGVSVLCTPKEYVDADHARS